jgi:7-cyano-7-deazaguanine synthase
MRDVVVLCSGGLDSAVLLWRAHLAGRLRGVVWCNYGQPAGLFEWRAMRELVRILRPGPEVRIHEAALTTVEPGSRMLAPSGEPGPRIVPARNLVMLGHAANHAAAVGASVVWYGPTADDQADYPDCRPAFVAAMNVALAGEGITIEAPLIAMSGREIAAEARELGLPIEVAWSCYTPRWDLPCGTCNSCLRRAEGAIERLGVA